MIKKISLLVVVISLFIITGCGEKGGFKNLKEYLNKKYPNDEFKILGREFLDGIKSTCGDTKKEDGYKYFIISNTTNIKFEIEDAKEATSYGTCYYVFKDNYYEQAFKQYIQEFGDTRINTTTHMSKADIKIDYKLFKSSEEMSNVLYEFKMFYENKKPFFNNNDLWTDVYVYNGEKYLGSFLLSHSNKEITLDNIKNEISTFLK